MQAAHKSPHILHWTGPPMDLRIYPTNTQWLTLNVLRMLNDTSLIHFQGRKGAVQ